MTIVIYDCGEGPEVFGPFEDDRQADQWIKLRQNNWCTKDRWTGKFIITDLQDAFSPLEKDDRVILLGKLWPV